MTFRIAVIVGKRRRHDFHPYLYESLCVQPLYLNQVLKDSSTYPTAGRRYYEGRLARSG